MDMMPKLFSKRKGEENKLGQLGFSLIEVLVSVFVIAIGSLLSAAMVLNGARINSSSYMRQTAQQYAYDIIDKMRANSSVVSLGNYALASNSSLTAPASDCKASICSSADMATYDLYQFWSDVHSLPAGDSIITTTANGTQTTVSVTISWSELGSITSVRGTSSAAPTYTNNTTISLTMQTLI